MSKLLKAIEQLMAKQKEVELYTQILQAVDGLLPEAEDHPGAREKVLKDIGDFCSKRIMLIEGSEDPKPRPKPAIKEDSLESPQNAGFDEEDPVLRDPLKFVVKFREWEGKTVYVRDGYGNQVEAKVSGARFPDLLIELSDGNKLPAHPRDVRLKIEQPKGGKNDSKA